MTATLASTTEAAEITLNTAINKKTKNKNNEECGKNKEGTDRGLSL